MGLKDLLLITFGDANGLGIEVILKGLKRLRGRYEEYLFLGCEKLYGYYQKRLGFEL